MTRLLTCGWETGDVNEAGVSTVNSNAVLSIVSSTPTPRAGSYCMKNLGNSNSGTTSANYKTFALGGSKTDVWMRWAVYASGFAGEAGMALVSDAAAGVQSMLTYTSTDGLLRLRLGNLVASTLYATASVAFSQNAWHVIEWRHQMTNATTGVSEVWLDGTRVINFAGDNSATATINVVSVALGIVTGLTTAPAYFAIDDIAINDTAGTVNNGRAGDGRVVLLVPTGAGSSTLLTRGGTDTGANYSQVNEIPPSLTQYVGSSTAGDRDLYAMGNLSMAVSSINCVEAIVLAQNSDAGAGSIAPTIKSGATTNEAAAIGLGTAAGYVTSRWETDPATTVAWTATGVNALEAGVTVR